MSRVQGLSGTAALVGEDNLPAEYRATLDATYRPCSMITVNVASRKRLIEALGMLSFAKSRRLAIGHTRSAGSSGRSSG